MSIMFDPLKKILRTPSFFARGKQKGCIEAYDIWASSYDAQPGNLMLDMDEVIFAELLKEIVITGKQVADIGCGTGRHWQKILQLQPAHLTGYDVSAGMLDSLKRKFPNADVCQITNNIFTHVTSAKYDVIISTLTVAHIKNLKEAINSWSRMLKPAGDIIITDFHPNTLAGGGKRTFSQAGNTIAIRNFVHLIPDIERILLSHNLQVVKKIEKKIDASVKHYYADKNALLVYEKFEGGDLIYGIHLKRFDGTQ